MVVLCTIYQLKLLYHEQELRGLNVDEQNSICIILGENVHAKENIFYQKEVK
jgi:hypothetical protein